MKPKIITGTIDGGDVDRGFAQIGSTPEQIAGLRIAAPAALVVHGHPKGDGCDWRGKGNSIVVTWTRPNEMEERPTVLFTVRGKDHDLTALECRQLAAALMEAAHWLDTATPDDG